MTTVPTKHRSAPTAEQAAHMTASWPGLISLPIQTQSAAQTISEQAKALRIPATKQWIAGRVATLLSQYFASSVPVEVMAAIAEDWHEELKAYPSWAIQNACRWWMSAENEKRRQKPIAGDISDRARIELGVVRVAENAVRRFNPENGPTVVEMNSHAPRVSGEEAAAICEEIGFAPKRFGGAE